MQWWHWVLIVAGIILLGFVKVRVSGAWLKKRRENQQPIEDE